MIGVLRVSAVATLPWLLNAVFIGLAHGRHANFSYGFAIHKRLNFIRIEA